MGKKKLWLPRTCEGEVTNKDSLTFLEGLGQLTYKTQILMK